MAAAASAETCSATMDRARGALFGALIGDALAMPSHWFYGGSRQVSSAYGGKIQGYVKPTERLPGSIMSKSNTGGGGRGSYRGNIIGDVVFHGRKKYWAPGADYHYHHLLSAGDNTLEGLLLRRVLAVAGGLDGRFDKDALTSDYVEFLEAKPNKHNETYCGTAHRMFFANKMSGRALSDCPDNDGHNVDTADALVTTIPVALLSAEDDRAAQQVAEMVRITRDSPSSMQFAGIFAGLLRDVVRGVPLREAVESTATAVGMRDIAGTVQRGGADPVTA